MSTSASHPEMEDDEQQPGLVVQPDNIDLVLVLDESGSMNQIRNDTISAVNSFIEEQKGISKARFSLVKFGTSSSLVFNRVPIEKAPRLSNATYRPDGMTALFDGIAL